MLNAAASKVLGAILKHDGKLTSYKIALLRAINGLCWRSPMRSRSYFHSIFWPSRCHHCFHPNRLGKSCPVAVFRAALTVS